MSIKEIPQNTRKKFIIIVLPFIALVTMSFTDADNIPASPVDSAFVLTVNPSNPSICPIPPDLLLKVTSPFGKRVHPIYGRIHFHKGVDLAIRMRTPVLAAADGVVLYASRDRENGIFIVLEHANGYKTGYYNLSKFAQKEKRPLAPGDSVRQGEIIALGGNTGRSTGPHLHYEVIRDGEHLNPELFYDLDNDIPSNHSVSENVMLLTFLDDSVDCDTNYIKPKLKSYRGKTTDKREFQALHNRHISHRVKSPVHEAQVVLEITVRADGVPTKVSVLDETPAGYGFGAFLKEWIRDCQFTPALEDSVCIRTKTIETVKIRL